MTSAIAAWIFSESRSGCTSPMSSVMSLKSIMLPRSMLPGSTAMPDASNAGSAFASSDRPDRSSDRPDMPAVSALSSMVNAACSLLPSMVNIDSMLRPPSSLSAPNSLPVNTSTAGSAS